VEKESVILSFQVNGLPENLFNVVRFSGTESIFNPFCYNLFVLSRQQIVFDSVIGKLASFTISGEAGGRTIHGRISQFAQTGYNLSDNKLAETYYQVCLVPEVWRLTRRHDLRVFQELTVEQILEKVFQAARIPNDQYEFRLSGTHTPREYCIQYRESDLDFISRIMESEGVYYFFDHQNSSKMIIADGPDAHSPIPESIIRFRPPSGMVESFEHVREFQLSQQILETQVNLIDHNYEEPENPTADATSDDEAMGLEFYDYPGGFGNQSAGRNLAQIRLEAFRAPAKTGKGESTCRRFAPGFKFSLEEHPRLDFNREYLITQEIITGDPSAYQSDFFCIPSDVPFRQPRRTPIPFLPPQTATVVGPSGEEIYTDRLGRIKIQFHWDRDGKHNEDASCWVRVKQALSGSGWGSIFIPRVGMEVVVEWMDDGGESRPLVTGCVYNGANLPPYPLPEEKTRSGIKSNSSKGGGGFNEISFEDRKGEEELFIHAQKDMVVHVNNDKKASIGNDFDLFVKRDQIERIERDRHLAITGDFKQKIDGSVFVEIGEERYEKIGSGHVLEAGSEIHLKAGTNIVFEASTSITLKAGGGFITINSRGVYVNGSKIYLNSGGSPNRGRGGGDQAAQAAALRQAAGSGMPFCEKCE
jgi:type VI secretion system secreted protein VgrG